MCCFAHRKAGVKTGLGRRTFTHNPLRRASCLRSDPGRSITSTSYLAHHGTPCGPPRSIVLRQRWPTSPAAYECNTCKTCHVPRPLLSPFHLLPPLTPLMNPLETAWGQLRAGRITISGACTRSLARRVTRCFGGSLARIMRAVRTLHPLHMLRKARNAQRRGRATRARFIPSIRAGKNWTPKRM